MSTATLTLACWRGNWEVYEKNLILFVDCMHNMATMHHRTKFTLYLFRAGCTLQFYKHMFSREIMRHLQFVLSISDIQFWLIMKFFVTIIR